MGQLAYIRLGSRSYTSTNCLIRRFEQIKRVHLSPTAFPEDLLTPTMKIKRSIAGKHFKDIIAQLYDAGTSEKRAAKL